MCGYAAFVEHWNSFAVQWQALLWKYELDELHTSDAYSFSGEYWKKIRERHAEQAEAYRDIILMDFARLAALVLGPPFGAVTATKQFRGYLTQNPNKYERKLNDTHYLAFESTVRELYRTTDFIKRSDLRAGIICDDHQLYSRECYDLLRKMKDRHPEIGKRIVSISFADSLSYIPLQAADLLAYHVRAEYERRSTGTGGEPPHIYSQLVMRGEHHIGFWTDDLLQKLLETLSA